MARQTGVDFTPLRAAISTGVHDTKRLRIAMYQRFGGGNMDEGWVGAVDERTIREYIENQNWDEDEEGFKIAARFPAGGHLGPVGMNFCSA